jgi:hypothetical protein
VNSPTNVDAVLHELRRIARWTCVTAVFVVAIFLLLAFTLLTVSP